MKKSLVILLSLVMLFAVACSQPAAPTTEAATEAGDGTTEATASQETGTTGDVIKIGGLGPLTGDVSVYGIASTNGSKLALDEINAAGGINGQQVNFEVLDEKGDETEAVNAYNKLIDSGIVALIGDITSKPTIAVAEVAATDNMPMITPTGTNPAITPIGPNVFRACFTDPSQGIVMANFAASNLGAKKVAVLYNTSDDYSQGIANTFKEKAEEVGMEVVAFEGYGADDVDYKTQLTAINAQKPDALMLPDYYNTVALIATQAREIGYEGAFLGADGWDGVLGVVDASNVAVLDNSFYSNHYFKNDPSQPLQDFLAKYKETYGIEANSFAALGYDAARILAQAIGEAGSTDSQAIIDALNKIQFEGITGNFTFDENGDPVKDTSVIEINGGVETLKDKVSN